MWYSSLIQVIPVSDAFGLRIYNLTLHFIMMNVVLDLTSEMNSFILRLVLSHVAFDISAFSIFAFANYDLAH